MSAFNSNNSGGILNTNSRFAAGQKGNPIPPSNVATTGIKWDEETIALHDLDRGTRQKVHI
jgi:hypothetical protein